MDHIPDHLASLYPLHSHAGDPSFWSAAANGAISFGRSIFQAAVGGLVVGAIGYLILIPGMQADIAVLKADVAHLKDRAEVNATVNAQQAKELELTTKQHDAYFLALERKIDQVEKDLHAHEVLDNRRLGR